MTKCGKVSVFLLFGQRVEAEHSETSTADLCPSAAAASVIQSFRCVFFMARHTLTEEKCLSLLHF